MVAMGCWAAFPDRAPRQRDAGGCAGDGRGAAACAVVLAREQAAATVRREVELDVLDEVLDGALRSEATLLQQAKRLGHDLLSRRRRRHRTDRQRWCGTGSRQRQRRALGGLEASIARTATTRGGRVLWRIRNNSAEFVLPAIDAGHERRLALTPGRTGSVVRSGGESAISVGVGTIRDGIADPAFARRGAPGAAAGRRMQDLVT